MTRCILCDAPIPDNNYHGHVDCRNNLSHQIDADRLTIATMRAEIEDKDRKIAELRKRVAPLDEGPVCAMSEYKRVRDENDALCAQLADMANQVRLAGQALTEMEQELARYKVCTVPISPRPDVDYIGANSDLRPCGRVLPCPVHDACQATVMHRYDGSYIYGKCGNKPPCPKHG